MRALIGHVAAVVIDEIAPVEKAPLIQWMFVARRRLEAFPIQLRSEEHTSELQSLRHLVCRLLLEKKKITILTTTVDIKILPHDEVNAERERRSIWRRDFSERIPSHLERHRRC